MFSTITVIGAAEIQLVVALIVNVAPLVIRSVPLKVDGVSVEMLVFVLTTNSARALDTESTKLKLKAQRVNKIFILMGGLDRKGKAQFFNTQIISLFSVVIFLLKQGFKAACLAVIRLISSVFFRIGLHFCGN